MTPVAKNTRVEGAAAKQAKAKKFRTPPKTKNKTTAEVCPDGTTASDCTWYR
jgi:hypothetical protein